jgi:putative transposase
MKKTSAAKATSKTQAKKLRRARYTSEFKQQSLARAASEGIAVTARDLGLAESQLYAWRKQATDAASVSEDERLHHAEFAKLKRDKARLEEEVAFLKKSGSVLCAVAKVKYAMIRSLLDKFSLVFMCRMLHVSSSGYYQWRRQKPSARAQSNTLLDVKIRDAYVKEKGRIGSPRVAHRLCQTGFHVSRTRVSNRMQSMGLRAKAARKFKATTNSSHSLPVAPNLLQQNFDANAPNQKWVSDITYIWTDEGWLYLAVVMDLYARVIVGWSMNERMTTTLVADALTMALYNRKFPKDVIVHSDRGSQYCSREYQALLSANDLVCSMSKRGDCYDNAAMESWNHSFKVEAVHGERFLTRDAARAATFEYINVYYNRVRLHSPLGYVSPDAFEAKYSLS